MKGMTCFENKIMAGALTISLILTSLALPVSAVEERQNEKYDDGVASGEVISEEDEKVFSEDEYGSSGDILEEDINSEPEIVTVEKTEFGSGLTWELDNNGLLIIDGNGEFSGVETPWRDEKYIDSVKAVLIKKDVKSVGLQAFRNCINLSNIEFETDSSYESLQKWDFMYCKNLKIITLPEGMKYVDGGAFELSGVEEIYFSSTIERIEGEFDCDLKKISVSSKNKLYDDRDGSNVVVETATNKLVLGTAYSEIPDTIEIIGSGSICVCAPEEVPICLIIPEGVRVIEEKGIKIHYSFYLAVEIPKSMKKIGCAGIARYVFYAGSKEDWDRITIESQYFKNACFGYYYNSHIDSDKIFSGKGGENIDWRFNSKGELIITGNGPMEDYNNFHDEYYMAPWYICEEYITSLIIGEGITYVGDTTIRNDSSSILRKVYISSTVKRIHEDMICSKRGIINSIVVSEENKYLDSRDNCNAVIDTATNTLLFAGGNSVIPSSVVHIGNGSFWGIERDPSLSDEKELFEEITVPYNVNDIGSGAFMYNRDMKKIYLPSSIVSIGADAFYGVDSLTDVYYGGSEEEWQDISIAEENSDLLNASIHFNYRNEGTPLFQTVTFDLDGGTGAGARTVPKGKKLYKFKNPIKEGYRFDGWYMEKSHINKYDFEEPVNSNFTLYASWVDDSSKSSSSSSSGGSSKTINKPISQISNPVISADTTTWDCVWFGKYLQEDENGDDKVDDSDGKLPIKWRVLERKGNDLFLLADKCLDTQPYNVNPQSITWESSSLRSWLNGYSGISNSAGIDYSDKGNSFIDIAFSDLEKEQIKSVNIKNDASQGWYFIDGGNDTFDKLFILSFMDSINSSYGFHPDHLKAYQSGGRCAASTLYSREKGVDYSSSSMMNNAAYWWLRSPGSYSYYAMKVDSSGQITHDYLYDVSGEKVGIRPALHVSLSQLIKYAGTVSSDWTENEVGYNESAIPDNDSSSSSSKMSSSSSGKSSSSSSNKGSGSSSIKDSSSSSIKRENSSSSERKESSSSTSSEMPKPYVPVVIDPDNTQHIEVETGFKDKNDSSGLLSIDTVKYTDYNGKKHVSQFDKTSKSAVGDVLVNVKGNITKYGTEKLKFKNNKAAWVSGRDKIDSKRPYFILSFKPDKGISKEEKQQIKAVNARLKNKPIYFDIRPVDISEGKIFIDFNKSGTKVSKVEVSVDGRTYKLGKKDFDIKSIEGEYLIVVGKGNFTGSKMVNR